MVMYYLTSLWLPLWSQLNEMNAPGSVLLLLLSHICAAAVFIQAESGRGPLLTPLEPPPFRPRPFVPVWAVHICFYDTAPRIQPNRTESKNRL